MRFFQFFWMICLCFCCIFQANGQTATKAIEDLSKKATTKTLNPFKLVKKGKDKRDFRLAKIILDSLKPQLVVKADSAATVAAVRAAELENKTKADSEKLAQLSDNVKKAESQVVDLKADVKSKLDAVHDTYFVYLPAARKTNSSTIKVLEDQGVELVPPGPDNKLSPAMATVANGLFFNTTSAKTSLDAFFDSSWIHNLRSYDSADAFKYKRSLRLTRKMEVVGFHPNANDHLPRHFYHVFSDLGVYKYTLDTVSYLAENGPFLMESDLSYNVAADRVGKSDFNSFITLSEHNPRRVKAFLANRNNWDRFFEETAGEEGKLVARNCKGVILDFANMPVEMGKTYADFVELFNGYLKRIDSNFRLYVIVPSVSPLGAYVYEKLQYYADRFIVDFTRLSKTGIDRFSIGSINDVNEELPAFLAVSNLDPRKVIVGLSFQGVEWQAVKNDSFRYPRKIPFGDITTNYALVGNNEKPPIFYFDSRDKSGYIQYKTWFDNEISLTMKLDFVQRNNCAGIAILPVIPSADDNDYFCKTNYEARYDGLWSALLSKSFSVDTCVDTVKTIPFFQRVEMQLGFYVDMLLHPRDLPSFSDYPVPFYLRNFCIILFVLILILLAYYIYKIINVGDQWISRKMFSNLIIFLFVVVIACALAYAFLDPQIPIGIRSDKKRTPFTTYLIILGCGIIAGILIMNFLKLISDRQNND